MDTKNSEIGYRVKLVRKSLDSSSGKFTQDSFGLSLGVSRDAIANIECGRATVSDLFINHLCSTYNVNENWLRTGEGDMFLPVSRREHLAIFVGQVMADESMEFQRQFLEMLSALRPEQWELLRQMVDSMVAVRTKKED